MAELDPIIAEILLKGDDELLSALSKVGKEGAEHLAKIAEEAAHGAEPLNLFADGITAVGAAVSGITAALVAFIEQQTELSQKTELLANAFGVTAGQLQELEQVFASSGVKVEQFERFANRLTITIAREWPQIAESIKTYANENDAATLRVSSAILRVRDAQNALGDNSEQRSSQMSKNNDALEASYTKLQFAAQHAASEQRGAQLSVEGAVLSVTAAQQHLAELQGNPPTAGAKAALALEQAQLAVDNARKSETDARVAQQEKAAGAALKARQVEQEYSDLARKASKDARDDAEQREKDENRVKEAVIARGETEEKAAKFALTNASSIRGALDTIVSGNGKVKAAIDLTQVSVENLTKGIIAQAAESAKGATPTAYETLRTITNLFTKDVEHQIDTQQRLAIVNKLSGTSMQALGVSAAEILDVIENDSKAIDGLKGKLEGLDKSVDPAAIKAFRGALADLLLQISQLSQAFAAAAAPAFTSFLQTIQASLKDSDGILHIFIEGIKGLSSTVSEGIRGWIALEAAISSALGVTQGTIFKALLLAIAGVVAAFATSWAAIPVAIGLVIAAVGYLVENAGKLEAAFKDNFIVRFFERAIDVATKFYNLLMGIKAAMPGGAAPGAAGVGSAAAQATGQAAGQTPGVTQGGITGLAGGGQVHGPGTTTSDSVLARLSRGEFVVKAAAVQAYGTGLFHALNNMQLPGFATGGLVPAPVRLAGGGSVPATSTLNLSIDGRNFNGLRGPKSTVDELSSFAIARQTSAAGSNPSWMK
jgi:transcriptional regulator with XRE-family HTH domain